MSKVPKQQWRPQWWIGTTQVYRPKRPSKSARRSRCPLRRYRRLVRDWVSEVYFTRNHFNLLSIITPFRVTLYMLHIFIIVHILLLFFSIIHSYNYHSVQATCLLQDSHRCVEGLTHWWRRSTAPLHVTIREAMRRRPRARIAIVM